MIDPTWDNKKIETHLRRLDHWSGDIAIEPLVGGT